MNKFAAIFTALLFFAASAAEGSALPGCAEKLPLDGQVRVGKLDNGMTYYIRHHDNPRQRADFFIAHNVGALQEEDNQDGLAHFLEHMAFNGTKNFPGKELLNYLATIGVRFGYNVNAYTSRERTVYNVSNVPMGREGVVDSLLLILHDWSYYISCEAEEIEAERGVIREEWRRGDDARSRMIRKTAEFEYNGSKYARRDVIGDPEIVNSFERQTLIDFYHKWYRPDLQAVIIVGDVDVDRMEAKVREVMSAIPKAADPAPKEIYTIPGREEPRYGMVTDPETKAVSVKLFYRTPYPTPAERETVAVLHDELARKVFLEMVRARIAEAEKDPGADYKRVVAVLGNLVSCKNTFQLTALPKQKNMRRALRGMLTDVERIRRYGFGEAEFEAAKARVAHAESTAAEKFRLAGNTDLAGLYVEHFTRSIPYMTPDDRARVTAQEIGRVTLEELNNMREKLTSERDMLVLFSAPDQDTGCIPSEEQTRELMDSVKRAQVAPLEQDDKTVEPLFTREVKPGRVVKTAAGPYDAVEWTLSNGVKVFWRNVPEVIGANKTGVYAVSRGGFARDEDVEGMNMLQNYVRTMGVGEMDRMELRNRLFDRDANVMVTLGKNSTSLSGSSGLEDTELLLQLLHLYMTEPNFSEGAYGRFADQCRSSLKKERAQKMIFGDSADRVKYGGHPWLRRFDSQTVARFDREAARRLYDKLFGNAADYVFFFAGEMTAAEARPLVEKYIGSLPVRPRQKFAETDFEIVPGVRDFEYVSHGAVTPKASIERIYHGTFNYTPRNYATLRYVSYILGARYLNKVREEKGGTYYIGVHEEAGAQPRGYCHLTVRFDTDPKLSGQLLDEVQKGIGELAAEAPSGQEVMEAMRYFRKVNAERKSKNEHSTSYWLGKMQSKYFDGVELDKDNEAIFTAVTPGDIRRLTHRIIAQGNRFTSVFSQE